MQFQQKNQLDYTFITEQAPTLKKGLIYNTSLRGKILIFGVVIAIVIALLSIILSVALKDRDKTTPNLLAIAQTQAELMRVADLGVANTTPNSTAQTLAVTTKQSVQTDQQTILAILKSRRAVIPKSLSSPNSTTDAVLNTAKQSNTYDTTFTSVLAKLLNSYQGKLKTAYDEASSTQAKASLSKAYNNATTLTKAIPVTTTPASQ